MNSWVWFWIGKKSLRSTSRRSWPSCRAIPSTISNSGSTWMPWTVSNTLSLRNQLWMKTGPICKAYAHNWNSTPQMLWGGWLSYSEPNGASTPLTIKQTFQSAPSNPSRKGQKIRIWAFSKKRIHKKKTTWAASKLPQLSAIRSKAIRSTSWQITITSHPLS